jgi:hypothetical protein
VCLAGCREQPANDRSLARTAKGLLWHEGQQNFYGVFEFSRGFFSVLGFFWWMMHDGKCGSACFLYYGWMVRKSHAKCGSACFLYHGWPQIVFFGWAMQHTLFESSHNILELNLLHVLCGFL